MIGRRKATPSKARRLLNKQAASSRPLPYSLPFTPRTRQRASLDRRPLPHHSARLNPVWRHQTSARLLRGATPSAEMSNSPGLGGGEKRREKKRFS